MRKTYITLAGVVFGLAFNIYAQTAIFGGSIGVATPIQPAVSDSIVSVTADAYGLAQVAPVDLPFGGTYWEVLPNGIMAPLPCPPLDQTLPIYAITDTAFLVDSTGGQVAVSLRSTATMSRSAQSLSAAVDAQGNAIANLIEQVQGAQMLRDTAMMFGMDMPMLDDSASYVGYSFDTNQLWLEITNVANGISYLNLHNATNQVYAIWTTTDLLQPFTVETELWPTDGNCQPFTLANYDRQNLFVRAMDWTGVTHGGNLAPDWWLWKYFGTTSLSDTNLDSQGNTLLYDYTNNIAPNDAGKIPVLISTINVANPVALKWNGTNLYVLSGSTATLTKFDTNGNAVASVGSLGSNPSGFDVDAAGNAYVAVKSANQVWKLKPTGSSFVADTNFGVGGFIGNSYGFAGTTNGWFNAPFAVAVSPDGETVSVSDSGNNRIQQFSTNGTFTAAFGSPGSGVGQFNTPQGLTYDSVDNLYIVDAGNNQVVLASDSAALGSGGTSGKAFGQFNAPAGVSVGARGIYVADTGNNRIQCFNPLENGIYSFDLSNFRFAFSANFKQPFSVAAMDNLTNELFYVADTCNNRVLLYKILPEDPTPAWTNLTAHIAAGDIVGAVSAFSIAATNNYQQAFVSIGTNDLNSAISQIGTLTPVSIGNDAAEYYFTNTIDGQIITFPVEFVKENGVWKILEF